MGHLGVGRAGIVGLSHGARIAMAAAGRLGRQIYGMVVMSVGLKTGARAQAAIRSWRHVLDSGGMPAMAWAMVPHVFGEAFLCDHRALLPKVVDALVQRNDSYQMANMLDAQMRYDPSNRLPTPRAFPILVVVGEEDLLVTPENARQLAEAVNGRWVCLNRVGHSIPAEAPDQLLELIDDFF
jgi:pimeloyl-ACP methyl ester carboxylesterase